MDERKDTGKVIDMQAMLKSMEMEWGKVKGQEMESIKKEVEEAGEENLKEMDVQE